MINSTMPFGSESASFLLIWFFHTCYFSVNGNFLFSPFSHLVNNPTAGQDSLNTLTSPKNPILSHLFLAESPGPKEYQNVQTPRKCSRVEAIALFVFISLSLEFRGQPRKMVIFLLCMYLVFSWSNSSAMGSYFHSHFLGVSSRYLPVYYFLEGNS